MADKDRKDSKQEHSRNDDDRDTHDRDRRTGDRDHNRDDEVRYARANTIDGTAGDDKLEGTDGDDRVSGGDGDDNIKGGDGNDTLLGGAGDDKIDGGDGDDSISGGTGDDRIDGGDGNDSIFGGAGDDKIDGEDGNDSISGGDGSDAIKGGKGDDTILGGPGDDKIDGEDGNDIVDGGDGDDFIDGGKGDDTLQGGAGDDTLEGGKDADTFIIRDGHGSDTISDFDDDEDVIAFDMAEIQSYRDVLDRMSHDGDNTYITYDNGDRVTLNKIEPEDLSAANFTYNAGPICFHAGTLILTPSGPRPVEALMPGDLVTTADNGPRPVLWRTSQRLRFLRRDDPAKPVLIPRGALGDGLPLADLIVSPQHRIAVTGPGPGPEVLVAAAKLARRSGIRRMRGRHSARYHNLLLGTHELIFANGCRAETLLLTGFTRQKLCAAHGLPPPLPAMHPVRPIQRP